MKNFELHSKLLRAIPELKHASRIPCSQNVDVRLLNLFHLAIQNFHGQLVLCDVVNARAATTLIGTFYFYKIYAGNRFYQLPGLDFNPLPMNEMAGVIVPNTP